MKGAVRACELNEDNDKFYCNSVEAINKLIKHWQNLKKKKQIKQLFRKNMKNWFNVKTGMFLSSPYIVLNEFSGYARNFQTEYALLPFEEKKKVKNTLLNVLVEPNQYNVVKNFKAGSK